MLVGPCLNQQSTQSLEKSRQICNGYTNLGHKSPAIRYLLYYTAMKCWTRLWPKSLHARLDSRISVSHRAVVQSALAALKSLDTSFKVSGLTS